MKNFLALALAGIMMSAASANAAEVWLVSLEAGQNPWTGGEPSLANGNTGVFNGKGNNSLANTDAPAITERPCDGGPGLCVTVSGTARMGVVLSLSGGSEGSDQISTFNGFFDSVLNGDGTPDPNVADGIIELAAINFTGTNDNGEIWHKLTYSTGMEWALGNPVPPPFIENFHQISEDKATTGPVGHLGGGNSLGGNDLWLHTEIVVHGLPAGLDKETRLTWNFTETEVFGEDGGLIGNQTADQTLEGPGSWTPRNALDQKSAWPIQVAVPEPATMGLVVIGAVALLRRRRN
jgi:hypothetical protein